MVGIESYSGYDKDWKLVGSRTARDAKELIDPTEVDFAIQNVIQALDQFKMVQDGLKDLIDDSAKAVMANVEDLGKSTEKVAKSIGKSIESLKEEVDEYYDLAVKKHDELQTTFNNEARTTVRHMGGVVYVE